MSSAVCPSGGLLPTLACNPSSIKPELPTPSPPQLPGVQDALCSTAMAWPLLAGRWEMGVEQDRAAPRSPSASFLHLPHRSHQPHRTHSLSIQQTSWVPRRWVPWLGSPCSAGWRPWEAGSLRLSVPREISQIPPHCQSLCGASWGSENPQNSPHQILILSHVPRRGPAEGTQEAPNPAPS